MYSSIKPKPCFNCGSPYHSAMYHKPRKPIVSKVQKLNVRTLPKRSKRPKQIGKQYSKWQATKAEWFATNSNYQPCHYCGIGLKPDTMTLDHKISRSRSPELRYDLSNLVPCCFPCNGRKGSIDHDNFNHDCPDGKKEATT